MYLQCYTAEMAAKVCEQLWRAGRTHLAGIGEKLGDAGVLTGPDFQNDQSISRKSADISGNLTVNFKTVLPSVEGHARIVVAHVSA